jgi:hypothetical protein
MALVWRYSTQDPTTAHYVYATPSDRDPDQLSLGAVSHCGLVDVGDAARWLGTSRLAAKHLEQARACPRCTSRVAVPPELAPTP